MTDDDPCKVWDGLCTSRIIARFWGLNRMIRVGIVGATGYGGQELLRLLLLHPDADVVSVTSTSVSGQPVADSLTGFRKLVDLDFESFDAQKLTDRCDVVFLGVPGGQSMELGSALRSAGARVVDLGPDFRLKSAEVFTPYYKKPHTAPELLGESVYGMPAFHRDTLKTAQLVAAPGCYPIGAVTPLRPIAVEAAFVVPPVIDAISGVSGAGKSLKDAFHFAEMNENVWAYKLGEHQHIPEIEQELLGKTKVQFSPHVGPYTRGILTTITVRPDSPLNLPSVYSTLAHEPFVRILGEGLLPDLNAVRGTNFVDIGWVSDTRTGNIVIVSALDNLCGGTAGIAIQCMNLMFGLDERTGLMLGGTST